MGNLLLLNGQQTGLATGTKSLNFNGTTQNVTAADSTSFDAITTTMTLAVWVKGPVSNGNNQEIFCKADTHAGGNNQWSWEVYKNATNGSGLWGVFITAGGNPNANRKNYNSGANVAFDNTNWYLIGFSYSGGAITMYQNGVAITPAIVVNDTVNSIFVGTANVSFGSRLNNNAIFAPYVGKGYAPAVWNVALSSAAWTSMYNHGTPLNLTVNQGNYASAANLVSYYKMAVPPDTTSSLTDYSGNSNTGTCNNIIAFDADIP